MTNIDTRPPLNLNPDHTPPTDHLRWDCSACGEQQSVTVAYEHEDSRMTGTSSYLVYRCGGCRERIPGGEIQHMEWAHRNRMES